MQRIVTTEDGYLAYRTRRMPYKRAVAFAKMVKANGRYYGVKVVMDDGTYPPRCWRVVFTPRTRDAQWRLREEFQRGRSARAATEGEAYEYELDLSGSRPVYRCFNPRSGSIYHLDSGQCSCPDYQRRLRSVEWTCCQCKHQVEMHRRFEAGELLPLSEAYELAPYRGYAVPAGAAA